MKLTKKSGAMLALAAASVFMTSVATVQIASAEDAAVVHCAGVNSCKGLNSCKNASHACKGQGSCKGTGFVDTSAEVCKQIGGTVG